MPLDADELKSFEERELGKLLEGKVTLAKSRQFMLVMLHSGWDFYVIDLTKDDRQALEEFFKDKYADYIEGSDRFVEPLASFEIIQKEPEWMAKHIAEAQDNLQALIGKRTPYIRPP